MDNLKETQRFGELVVKFREGQISDGELRQFKEALRVHAWARKYYIETCIIHSVFQGKRSPLAEKGSFFQSESWNQELWNELASEESQAETVEVERKQPEPQIASEKPEIVKIEHRTSKTLLFSVLSAIAALFLFIATIQYWPFQSEVKVAILSDSINARWANTKSSMEKGSPMPVADYLLLREGFAELLFNNNARVTLEAPVEFQILAEDQIRLRYGRLFATVPQEAIGFTVTTQTAKVIDLGTAFGVQADSGGDIRLHVIAGKTTLIAGEKINKISMEVVKDSAKRVSGTTQKVSDIPCDKYLFARSIDSASKLVWRGQPRLDLSDLVGGGNGFGTGSVKKGIDLTTGQIHLEAEQGYTSTAAAKFHPVKECDFIDGVFVPNGSEGPTVINSQGLTFEDFPKTSGQYWSDITPNPYVKRIPVEGKEWTEESGYFLTLLDVEKQEGDVVPPRLLIHPNAGITFDLEKIRQAIPDVNLTAFRAVCGLPAAMDFQKRSEFWVLVDGKRVFHAQADYQNTRSRQIDIKLSPADRYLTLATTDGGDSTHYDWCIFAEPYLYLERR